jgi:phage baseplate assembly protein V
VSDLKNQINHIARVGIVSAAPDESGVVQQLQIKINNYETSDSVVTLGLYGVASSPLPGASAMILNLAGNNQNGAVIATQDGRYRPKGMVGGEVQLYDNNGQSVYLTVTGGKMSVRIVAKDEVSITANTSIVLTAPGVTVNGNLTVTGNLTGGTGATGTFPTASGLTVTVRDGSITNIF